MKIDSNVFREKLIVRLKKLRERQELHSKKGTSEDWCKCIMLDGQIMAIENIIMEL